MSHNQFSESSDQQLREVQAGYHVQGVGGGTRRGEQCAEKVTSSSGAGR